jgi:prepilin-type N-terminal cleavage/methylation domain-containing protein
MSHSLNSHRKIKAFTLIEMSISLTIVGVVVIVILLSQSVVHRAKSRSVISQMNGYNAAVNIFQLTYGAMPGDIINATSVVAGATTNGNGDGFIGNLSTSGYANITYTAAAAPNTSNNNQYTLHSLTASGTNIAYEYSAFWQHLTANQLISGKYIPTNTILLPNVNMPSININNAIGIIAYYNQGDGFNYYQLGATSLTIDGNCITQNFLSPSDAFYIDSKIDDGFPASGMIAARGLNTNPSFITLEFAATYTGSASINSAQITSCVIGTSYANSTKYNLAAPISAQLCQLRIRIN